MYSVVLSVNAKKYIDKLNFKINKRIKDKLKNLKTNPVPSDVKFIGRHEGEKIFRYRIGDYRALYKLKESKKIILISKIDKRPRIYK